MLHMPLQQSLLNVDEFICFDLNNSHGTEDFYMCVLLTWLIKQAAVEVFLALIARTRMLAHKHSQMI